MTSSARFTFATLVFGNLALILVNRSWRLSIWQSFRQRRNATLKWILSVATAVLIALLQRFRRSAERSTSGRSARSTGPSRSLPAFSASPGSRSTRQRLLT